MVGVGESYFPAFVLALGLGEIASGLIASVPILVGAVLQLISPWGVARLGSNRRWVLTAVILQAASFLPLVAAALTGRMPAVGVFAAVSLYWAGGLAAGPAWNTWMETVVPFRVRAPFFAMRTRVGQAGVLLGFVGAGLALQFGKNSGQVLLAFAAIFSVASICRFISGRYLLRQSEPAALHIAPWSIGIGELLGRIREGKSERTLLYFLTVQVAAQMAGPYFSPYMLKQLRLSYLEFMMLLAISFLAKTITLPAFGRFAARFGARRLLWLGGVGIIPMSGLWLYAHGLGQLLFVQFLAGTAWAAYELAMFLLFFETVRREERTSILTIFNLCNAVALAIGSLSGGALLKFLDSSREAYLVLFALSSCARVATLAVLWLSPEVSSLVDDGDDEPRLQPASVPAKVAAAPSR